MPQTLVRPTRVSWRRYARGELGDITAAILLGITVAVALRARSVPLHVSPLWFFAGPIGAGLFRATRLRRIWFIVCAGATAGVLVSWPWIR